jgi:hypothetical protein
MVTDIGAIALTDNQRSNWKGLITGIWTWLGYQEGHVTAQSENMPQPSDITALQTALAALPDTPQPKPFSVIQFQTDLATAAISGQFTGMADPVIEFAPLNTYAVNNDFIGMSQYLQWRLALGKVIQADIDVLKALLLTQGVVLP